jgi:hypothetical protein
MNRDQNKLIDDFAELAKAEVISWEEATEFRLEQILGAELLRENCNFSLTRFSKILRYWILDAEILDSVAISLYVRYDVPSGEPTSFCFKNNDGLSIPLDVHTKSELICLKTVNEYTEHHMYFTDIQRLTREVYLSALVNRYKDE